MAPSQFKYGQFSQDIFSTGSVLFKHNKPVSSRKLTKTLKYGSTLREWEVYDTFHRDLKPTEMMRKLLRPCWKAVKWRKRSHRRDTAKVSLWNNQADINAGRRKLFVPNFSPHLPEKALQQERCCSPAPSHRACSPPDVPNPTHRQRPRDADQRAWPQAAERRDSSSVTSSTASSASGGKWCRLKKEAKAGSDACLTLLNYTCGNSAPQKQHCSQLTLEPLGCADAQRDRQGNMQQHLKS